MGITIASVRLQRTSLTTIINSMMNSGATFPVIAPTLAVDFDA